MNIKKQLLNDYINCNKQIKFLNRIKKDKNYEDLFSFSEIDEMINYYKDMKRFIIKDILKRGELYEYKFY